MTSVPDARLIERVRSVFALDEATIAETLHPDFNRYFRRLLGNPAALDAYLDEVRYLCCAPRLCGHVLDLASGFGVAGICLRALGVEKVTGVDLVETKVSTARKLAERVCVNECSFLLGNAAALPLEDASVDGVLIKDAASHFRDPRQVYAEVSRVLRPGGWMVLSDDRNALNEAVRSATERVWEVSETGSPNELAKLGLSVCYTQMRRDYIVRRFPSLGEGQADWIAQRTRGYTYVMLETAVPRLLEDRDMDLIPAATCINPENEIVQERLLDPIELCRELRRHGLDARVLPPSAWDAGIAKRRGSRWRGLWRRRLAQVLWSAGIARTRLIKRTADFLIAARKR
jgi:ubiquinone/menaquinone biosynthesis C-methylase UbiE